MIFKIKSKNQTINLNEEQLFTQILTQVFKEKENTKLASAEDYVFTIEKILSALNSNKSNIDTTFRQLYTIYFLCGYYYKVFTTKNNVQFEKEN